MIKAVIFDVGGVLVRTEDHSHRRLWEKELGLVQGELESIVFNSEMGRQAQMGLISDDALWGWVGLRLQLSKSRLSALRKAFWAGDVLDQELVAGIRQLRPRYRTAIISNATDALMHNLSTVYQIADAFDLIIGSASEGIMKPDVAIYKRALDRLDLVPEEAVFVDDFIENIRAAEQIGIHAIHYQAGSDVFWQLDRLGVK